VADSVRELARVTEPALTMTTVPHRQTEASDVCAASTTVAGARGVEETVLAAHCSIVLGPPSAEGCCGREEKKRG
jgi:hypothetical protein